jgi:elongation factor G
MSKKHATADIRNLAFIGGPGTGKTSLVEAALFKTGAIDRLGSVGDGTTVTDFEDDEREKRHTIRTTFVHSTHKGRVLHLLDAPGYPDFVGETVCALACVEVAVLCINAHQGLTFPGHKIWSLAGKMGKARCLVVTHVDHHEFDVAGMVQKLSEGLGARCLPISMPTGTGSKFGGIAGVPIGGQGGDLAEHRAALIEAVVEIDDDAMTRFLEEDKLPDEAEARDLLTRSIVAGEVIPVAFVSSLDGQGVGEFLDFVAHVFPSPVDGPYPKDAEGQEVKPDADGMTALVVKTVIDPFVGRLCFLRLICGQLEGGASLDVVRTEDTVKAAHLQLMQGKDHQEVHSAVAGDIVAVAKVDDLETGDTLNAGCSRSMGKLPIPRPMAARAIEPANHADDIKLSTALRRAISEDPAFSFDRHEDTGELVIHGTSVMHLEANLKRINDRSHVEVLVHVPHVALRESITGRSPGHHRHKKQTGGRGQFAEVFLEVEPADRGSGLVFLDETVGGSIPRQYLPAVEKGVRETMSKGVIAGHLIEDVTVRVKDGKFHDVDSDEASFKMAAGRAFKDGFMKSHPVLLEPMLDVEVAIPSRFMGAITSDMTGRRGQITGMDSLGDIQVVTARVPQREVMTYPTVLHSLTSGEGSYSAEFHDYEVVPSNIQKEIMAEFRPEDED